MDKETLERRELWERSQVKNYINGKFKSSQYTEEELLEKRKCFENQLPNPSSGFQRKGGYTRLKGTLNCVMILKNTLMQDWHV